MSEAHHFLLTANVFIELVVEQSLRRTRRMILFGLSAGDRDPIRLTARRARTATQPPRES